MVYMILKLKHKNTLIYTNIEQPESMRTSQSNTASSHGSLPHSPEAAKPPATPQIILTLSWETFLFLTYIIVCCNTQRTPLLLANLSARAMAGICWAMPCPYPWRLTAASRGAAGAADRSWSVPLSASFGRLGAKQRQGRDGWATCRASLPFSDQDAPICYSRDTERSLCILDAAQLHLQLVFLYPIKMWRKYGLLQANISIQNYIFNYCSAWQNLSIPDHFFFPFCSQKCSLHF